MGIGIVATGSCLGERVVTNEEMCALAPDATPDWIFARTGIVTRRYAADETATSDLAAGAAIAALEQAGLAAGSIDYLIVATSTGDFPLPPTACLVQDKIGAGKAACFDINVVCSGFVYGLEIARCLVSANRGTYALVIGADLYSRIMNYKDRRSCVLPADGAGAVIMAEVPEPAGLVASYLASHGDAHDLIKVPAGGSRLPTSAATLADDRQYFAMKGRGVRDFVFDNVPPLLDKLLDRAGVTTADVDCFIPHQANALLINELAERSGLAHAHKHRIVAKYGNLGSGSIPVTLDEAVRNGMISAGDLVLMAGFGGGMTAGACLVRWAPRTGDELGVVR